MPADRKQVDEAVERLRVDLDTHDRGGLSYAASDGESIALVNAEHLRLLLTDHAALLARLEAAVRAQKPRAGTIGGALREYEASADFRALAFSTQGEYGRLIKELDADCGPVVLTHVTRPFLRELRDGWAIRGHKAANDRMQVLKNALQPAIDDELVEGDPFARLKKVSRPHDAGEVNPAWEDSEFDAAIAEALRRDLPGLARALALGRWGGFRRATITTIPRHARLQRTNERGEPEARLYWMTSKRLVLCDKREDPRLTALLNATPSRALTIAYNARGAPWQPRQLNQAIDRLMTALAKDGRARAAGADEGVYCPLTIHGLRHARGVELAEAGASDAEIMSQLEHATDRSAKIYRRQAARRKMADAGQDRVDTVVSLRAARAKKAGAAG